MRATRRVRDPGARRRACRRPSPPTSRPHQARRDPAERHGSLDVEGEASRCGAQARPEQGQAGDPERSCTSPRARRSTSSATSRSRGSATSAIRSAVPVLQKIVARSGARQELARPGEEVARQARRAGDWRRRAVAAARPRDDDDDHHRRRTTTTDDHDHRPKTTTTPDGHGLGHEARPTAPPRRRGKRDSRLGGTVDEPARPAERRDRARCSAARDTASRRDEVESLPDARRRRDRGERAADVRGRNGGTAAAVAAPRCDGHSQQAARLRCRCRRALRAAHGCRDEGVRDRRRRARSSQGSSIRRAARRRAACCSTSTRNGEARFYAGKIYGIGKVAAARRRNTSATRDPNDPTPGHQGHDVRRRPPARARRRLRPGARRRLGDPRAPARARARPKRARSASRSTPRPRRSCS